MLMGVRKTDMATDIRRMSKDELDALNENGRKWREHNKPAEDQKPEQQAGCDPDDANRSLEWHRWIETNSDLCVSKKSN